jgi:hypothetical protein
LLLFFRRERERREDMLKSDHVHVCERDRDTFTPT